MSKRKSSKKRRPGKQRRATRTATPRGATAATGPRPLPPLPPRADGRPTLTISMITKNEEQFLRNCLASVRDLADEIVIMDTGSTDRTIEIAKEFGAKVGHFDWIDDFAAARNAALDQARGDWVLSLDADEEIAAEDHEKIGLLLRRARADAIQITTRNYCNRTAAPDFHPDDNSYPGRCRSAPGWVPSTKIRLWRRATGLRWQHRIHELLEPSAEARGVRLAHTRIPVHHYGLLAESRDKLDYYFELGRKAIAENPHDSKAHLEVALVLAQRGELDAARPYFEKAAELSVDPAVALVHQASALLGKLRFREARECAERALAAAPDYAPALHAVALLEHFQHHNNERAIELLRRATEITPTYALAHFNLARCLQAAGRRREALDAIRKATEIAPRHTPIIELHAAILLELNQPREALALLPESLVRKHSAWELWNRRGNVLARLGQFAPAQEAFARAAELAPEGFREPHRSQKAVAAWAQGEQNGCRGEQRPGITLCMIVRDEESNLPRCLASAAGAFDQIVVIDTGSTDRTPEIARECGAEVHHFAWEDDFAAARNASLRHAECRWVMWLDADDTLPPESREKLRNLAADRSRMPGALLISARMLREDSLASDTRQLRIFPNHPGVCFSGVIHEQVGPSLQRLGFPVVDASDILVEHHGYVAAHAARSKAERNLPLLIAAAEQEDATYHERHNLIRSYFGAGRPAEAIPYIHAILEDPLCPREAPGIYNQARIYLARILLAQDDLPGAMQPIQEILADRPDDPQALYYQGQVERKRANWTAALHAFKRAATSERGGDDLGTPTELLRYRARIAWAEICEESGDPQTAAQVARAARESAPERAEGWLIEARALHAQQRRQDAIDLLNSAIESCGPAPALCGLLGNLCFEVGEVEKALKLYSAIEEPTVAVLANRGKALVLLGRSAEALPVLEEALTADPTLLDVQCIIGDIHFHSSRPEQALQAYEAALRAGLPPSATTFARIGDTYRALGHPAAAEVAYQTAQRLNRRNQPPQQRLDPAAAGM